MYTLYTIHVIYKIMLNNLYIYNRIKLKNILSFPLITFTKDT